MEPSGEGRSSMLFDMAGTAMAVVDNLNDAVVVADEDGRILYLNQAITRVLGWEPAALLGQPVSVLVPERLRTAHLAGFERFVRTRSARIVGQPTRLSALTAEGGEHPVELVLSSLALSDGSHVVVASLRDVATHVGLERDSALANHLLDLFTKDLGITELVDETIAALGTLLDMPAVAFWAPGSDGRALRCEAFWRQPGEAASLEETSRKLVVSPGQGVVGRVWASRQPVWIPTLVDEASYLRRHEVAIDGLHSALAFPVRTRGHVLGVIELYTATASHPDEALLVQMTNVGRRLGEVLYSARLEEERRLLATRERAVAAAFRESLLPDSVPEIPHLEVGTAFSPGGEGVVGGDFYDVYPLAEVDGTGRWGFTIGDVCGTGPEAAAVTSKVRYTARALMRAGHDMVTVGQQLNSAMSGRRGRRFCTSIFGTIEVRDGEVTLRFVNAGHPPPVLRGAGGGAELLPVSGSLLGALPRVALYEQTVPLGPGESMVLYTDGVTEARRAGELFGEGRLAGLVAELGDQPAAAVATGVQRGVERFVDQGLGDDLAILVLRRAPQG